uniref:2-hydroxyacyl-CoA dehydratase n=1 Tax=candidate division WOR-3 bacterium TaxID=2052148 RepID=A0A7C2K4B1_UNCW3
MDFLERANFYENYILKLQKRLERLKESPDPRRLKANKLRYELEIEEAKEILRAWKEGKPFSNGGDLTAGILTKAMGFTPAGSVGAAFQTLTPQKYLDHAAARGLPVEKSCDMTMMPFAMMECGDLPFEDIAICDNHACTPMMLRGIYMAYKGEVHTYFIDIPFEQNDDAITYVADQLREFIEYAERKFKDKGIKYDEEKLVELLEINDKIQKANEEVYEMLKNKPCPIGGYDVFLIGGIISPSKKALEYVQARTEEIKERVDKGIGAIPDEKIRIMWTTTRPFFMDPFSPLSKWGANVCFYYAGPVGTWAPFPGRIFWKRELSPIEKVAALALSDQWGHSGTRWVEPMIWICRDLEIDAIINYNMVGCVATLGLRKIIEERAEKELGIPTLQLEGKQWDKRYADEKIISEKLETFAQLCLIQKGIL